MMELLSPAGGFDSLIAAVQTGADAVYMGFGAFNARRSAKNFTDEEFASAVSYCHLRGVRVFLTLNTLLTDRELVQAADALKKACAMGVDAILVQDWGLLTLAREIVPDVPLHASTQMSLFTLGGANEAAALGMERVVLARELNRDEVREMFRQVGPVRFDENGMLQSGMVVRHLVLPGAHKDSLRLLNWLADNFSPEDIRLSLMSQYTPPAGIAIRELQRPIFTYEYRKACERAEELGFLGYTQQRSSADAAYTPLFDGTGL